MIDPSGLAGHLFWLLLVLAALLPDAGRLRLALAGAALVALGHALLAGGGLAAAIWPSALLAVALASIALRAWENSKVRFTGEEQRLAAQLLDGLPRRRARHFLDQGLWLTGKAGDALTREGDPVTHLYYLAEGEARVVSRGVEVGACRPGDLIGELTALAEEPASATVLLAGPARFWCAPAAVLRPYLEANVDVRSALEHGFAASLRAKLRESNRAKAEAQGARG